MLKLILFGPPGAGKGTQAELICEKFALAHISTGDILRAHLKGGTPLGERAQAFINKGELVPDGIILDIIDERLKEADCAKGFVLDGFPRTIPQAEALSERMSITAVINLVVPLDKLAGRITSRRVCRVCGSTYNVHTYSGSTCKCGGELYQRDDDKEETVMNRLKVYHTQTEPLIDYYEAKGALRNIDGDRSIEEVSADIFTLLEGMR